MAEAQQAVPTDVEEVQRKVSRLEVQEGSEDAYGGIEGARVEAAPPTEASVPPESGHAIEPSAPTQQDVQETTTPSGMPENAPQETEALPDHPPTYSHASPSEPQAHPSHPSDPSTSAAPVPSHTTVPQTVPPPVQSQPLHPHAHPQIEEHWQLKTISFPPFAPPSLQRPVTIVMQNLNGPCSLLALCNILLLRGEIHLPGSPPTHTQVTFTTLSSLLAEYLLRSHSSPTSPTLASSSTFAPAESVRGEGRERERMLEAALGALPNTRTGIDLNPCFSGPDHFAPLRSGSSSSPTAPATPSPAASPSSLEATDALTGKGQKGDLENGLGELALFELCGVKLVHGWVADPQDSELYDVLFPSSSSSVPSNPASPSKDDGKSWVEKVLTRKGDYESALETVIEGEEIARKAGMVNPMDASGSEEGGVDGSKLQETAKAMDEWTDRERLKVHSAMVIRRFLTSTPTQLTVAGLFQLSASPTPVAPGSLVALLRNSHLSVLYRRPDTLDGPSNQTGGEEVFLPPPPDRMDASYDHSTALEAHAAGVAAFSSSSSQRDLSSLPVLYTLANDAAFAQVKEVVWESLEDVEGGASEFWNADMRRARVEERRPPNASEQGQGSSGDAGRRATSPIRGRQSDYERIGRPGKQRALSRDLVEQGYDERNVDAGGWEMTQEQMAMNDADLALAHQLQQEEYEQESALREAERARAQQQHHQHRQRPQNDSRSPSAAPSRRDRMEAKRSGRPLGPAGLNAGVGGSETGRQRRRPQAATGGEQKKEKCMIM